MKMAADSFVSICYRMVEITNAMIAMTVAVSDISVASFSCGPMSLLYLMIGGCQAVVELFL